MLRYLFIISFLFVGCGLALSVSAVTSDTQKDCKTNTLCFKKLLQTCQDGTFKHSHTITNDGIRRKATAELTITGAKEQGCSVQIRTLSSTLEPAPSEIKRMKNLGASETEITKLKNTVQNNANLVAAFEFDCTINKSQFSRYRTEVRKKKASVLPTDYVLKNDVVSVHDLFKCSVVQ
jgi:hypothetical protein